MLFRTAIREVTVQQLREQGRFHRVFNARAPNVTRADLPAMKIWTPFDNGENLSIGVPEMRGTLTLILQVVIEGTEDEKNARTVDDLCESVLHLLLEDGVWLRFMNRVLTVETDIESNTEGEMRTVVATITLSLQYGDIYVTRIIDYLDRAHVTVPLPGQPETPDGKPDQAVEFDVELPRT
jgi:hypothetical protein